MSGSSSHVLTGDSPSVPRPYADLQAKLEELDAYTHTALIQFPRSRTWATHKLPRKRNIRRARRTFSRLAEAYAAGDVDLDYIQPRTFVLKRIH